MLEEAEGHLLAGYETLASGIPREAENARDAARRLADLYDFWSSTDPFGGFADKALQWREKGRLPGTQSPDGSHEPSPR